MGYFVPRLRLSPVGGRLVNLWWATPAGLGRILRFIRLLALIRGHSLFRRLILRRSIPSSGKIHHISSEGRITHGLSMSGIVVCFSSLPVCGTSSLDGARTSLSLGASLPLGAGCFAMGGRLPPWTHLLSRGISPWPGRADPGPGEQLWQALPFPAWGNRLPSRHREYSFYRQLPKNLLCCEIEKASPKVATHKTVLAINRNRVAAITDCNKKREIEYSSLSRFL